MKSDYIPRGQIRLSYQNGLEASERSFTIARWLIVALAALMLFLFVSSIVLYSLLAGFARRTAVVERLEAENASLRTKVDFYATAVDSIYNMLGTVPLKKAPASTDYPSLGLGKPALKDVFAPDSRLQEQINSLETKLSCILLQVSDQKPQNPSFPAELAAGNLPADSMPSIYPSFGRISDGWGLRIHPISHNIEFHYGIDIANQAGTPIYATAAGIVGATDYDLGYGKRIIIHHANGYETCYAHIYSQMVRVGDTVSKGQIIGLMGNSGVSTGPHLHYEVHTPQGKVNPAAYLNRFDEPGYAMR